MCHQQAVVLLRVNVLSVTIVLSVQRQVLHRVVALIAAQEELAYLVKNVRWEQAYLYHVLEEVIVQTLVVT